MLMLMGEGLHIQPRQQISKGLRGEQQLMLMMLHKLQPPSLDAMPLKKWTSRSKLRLRTETVFWNLSDSNTILQSLND